MLWPLGRLRASFQQLDRRTYLRRDLGLRAIDVLKMLLHNFKKRQLEQTSAMTRKSAVGNGVYHHGHSRRRRIVAVVVVVRSSMRGLHKIEQVVVKVDVEEVRQGLAVDALSVISENAKDDFVNLKKLLGEDSWQRKETDRIGVVLA